MIINNIDIVFQYMHQPATVFGTKEVSIRKTVHMSMLASFENMSEAVKYHLYSEDIAGAYLLPFGESFGVNDMSPSRITPDIAFRYAAEHDADLNGWFLVKSYNFDVEQHFTMYIIGTLYTALAVKEDIALYQLAL